jgi:hypothetical protein
MHSTRTNLHGLLPYWCLSTGSGTLPIRKYAAATALPAGAQFWRISDNGLVTLLITPTSGNMPL